MSPSATETVERPPAITSTATPAGPTTLPAALLELAAKCPDEVALRYRQLGRWREYSWRDLADRAARIGAALERLGARPGDRLAIQSDNRPAWLCADLGAQSVGCAVLALPPGAGADELATHLRQARATVLFAGDGHQLAAAAQLRSQLPELETIVVLEPGHAALPDGVLTLDQLLEGTDGALESFGERVGRLDPHAAALIALTSGTTGPSRGVVLSHRAALAAARGLGAAAGLDHRDELLSCLPPHHVTERMLAFASVAGTRHVTNIGRRDERGADLVAVEPTFLLSTPQLWRDARAAVESRIEASGWLGRTAYARFVERPSRREPRVLGADALFVERPARPASRLARAVGSWLLVRPLRRQVGLRRLRRAWVVSAPASPSLARWLAALDVPLAEAYGLTEQGGFALVSAGVREVDEPRDASLVPGVELRVDDQGELLARGPALLSGYLDEPVALDPDGWLRTGDVARLDRNGHPVVLGRRCDVIVTRSGASVHPASIERKLRDCAHIRDSVVVSGAGGELIALVAIQLETCARWAVRSDISIASREDVFAHPAIHELIETRVAELNRALPDEEWIDRVVLLPTELRRAHGDLALLSQPRRAAITERFAAHWKEQRR